MNILLNQFFMVTIRRLEKDDYYRGYLTLLEQLTEVGNFITYQDFLDQFYRIINTDQHEIWVAEDNGKIVATGTLLVERKFIHNLGSVGHIEDIVVDLSYRGHKLGQQIVELLIGRARSIGCYKTILDCSVSNIGFYEKCNMKQKGVQMSIYFNDC